MARKGEVYYHVSARKPRTWKSLGKDYALALAEWAKIEGADVPEAATIFREIAALYKAKVIPTKKPRTQRDNEKELAKLLIAFGDSPIETIEPVNVRDYLDNRQSTKKMKDGATPPLAKTRANREIALLSTIINWAREKGITNMANPVAGVKKHSEPGRDRYVTDEEFDALYTKAGEQGDTVMQDAMDLLHATSQRPGDVVRMRIAELLRDGCLWGRQAKTGHPYRIEIEGDLKVALDRMQARQRAATGPYLVQDDQGQPITLDTLEKRWAKLREAVAVDVPSVLTAQLRDIRGKTATDLEDLEHAQKLLGHSSVTMTERYVKRRAGARVKPHSRRRKDVA